MQPKMGGTAGTPPVSRSPEAGWRQIGQCTARAVRRAGWVTIGAYQPRESRRADEGRGRSEAPARSGPAMALQARQQSTTTGQTGPLETALSTTKGQM
jgi:hypothetical protein